MILWILNLEKKTIEKRRKKKLKARPIIHLKIRCNNLHSFKDHSLEESVKKSRKLLAWTHYLNQPYSLPFFKLNQSLLRVLNLFSMLQSQSHLSLLRDSSQLLWERIRLTLIVDQLLGLILPNKLTRIMFFRHILLNK